MNEQITIIRSCVGLLLLWAFWQYGWKAYSIDLLRQSLFPLRNRLFALAAEKKMGLQFDSREYVALRQGLNRRIRYAHRVTFSHIWLAMLVGKLSGINIGEGKSKIDIAIEEIADENLKRELLEIKRGSDVLFLRHMVMTSPLFFAMIWLSTLWSLVTITFHASASLDLRVAIKNAREKVEEKELTVSQRIVSLQADSDDDASPENLAFA